MIAIAGVFVQETTGIETGLQVIQSIMHNYVLIIAFNNKKQSHIV